MTSKDSVLLEDLRHGQCSSSLCKLLRATAADEIERLHAARRYTAVLLRDWLAWDRADQAVRTALEAATRAALLGSAVETSSVALTPRCEARLTGHGHGDTRCAREIHHVGDHICPASVTSNNCRWAWSRLAGLPPEETRVCNCGELGAKLTGHLSTCPAHTEKASGEHK